MIRRTRPIEYIVLHHWGPPRVPATRQEALAIVRAEGYDDFPYNWLIAPDGAIWKGRDEKYESAANLGINHKAGAICLMGNFDAKDNPDGSRGMPIRPTDAQLIAAGHVLSGMLKRHPGAKFIQHRDVAKLPLEPGLPPGHLHYKGRVVSVATSCPGSRTVEMHAARIIFLLASGLKLDEARAKAAQEAARPKRD